ncbi:hypothetical protein ABWL43_18405 [Pseudomonas sp. HT11]|uniref:hypothetical protein n=1 Tax=Pseudomonas sp. HT11 TaxID=3230490 RepID=UPI00384D4810
MSWEVVSCWIESHPGLASWVQAFGSIAALGIAIWVASSQRRAQMRADRDKSKLMLSLVKTLAARSRRAVEFSSKERINLLASLNLIRGLSHSLDKIDLLLLPSIEVIGPICTLRDSLRTLEAGMSEADKQQYLATWLTLNEAPLLVALVVSSSKQIAELK